MTYTEPIKLQRPKTVNVKARSLWPLLLQQGAAVARGEFSHRIKGNTKVRAVKPMAPEKDAKSPMNGIAIAMKVAVATQGNRTAHKFLQL
mmetsp:Transcript_36316/g.67552  ORF Transcript_36316/g.67552 Transcript_36316/m.67552 type:complete len:90 (-) Transcript_36316:1085-1354(-)